MKSIPALCYERLDWWLDRNNTILAEYKDIFNPKAWAIFNTRDYK